ncbi:hypothetical protein K1Y78_34195 [Streptomyces sp. tea 10]|nr:hypothetical protein [Streptomyces sp. tea 10]
MAELIRRLAARMGLEPKRRSVYRRPVHALGLASTAPPPVPLPAHRSPYGLDTLLDGAATVAVRPYLVAHEKHQRRCELAMAILGLDMPGPYWIHEVEAG